ncbi:hypothetical protein BZZ01_19580 [Nostocales cyanobacterium HT-58-2]|nr:hypothetical protein BZZ01_19580 [Nostocales cyanobacterium HT-58-2]
MHQFFNINRQVLQRNLNKGASIMSAIQNSQSRRKSLLSVLTLPKAIAFLFLTPLFAQPLSAQALPTKQSMQVAMNDCITFISTATNTYTINVCQKADKKAEMVLQNLKTGEKFTLPAVQEDESGNVFRANLKQRKGFNTIHTLYFLRLPNKQFVIRKMIDLPGHTNVKPLEEVEVLKGILMS